MLEALMNSNKLNVNCSVACLIKDNEGFLDKFDGVNLNCGTYLASDSVNAKMLSLGANINTDRTIITGDDEEFVQISGGTLENGQALVKNHLYMATIAGRGFTAQDAVKVMVRGEYTVS